MAASRTILRYLQDYRSYLNQYHRTQQSTYFERLVAEAFSHILYLPFYTSDNDDNAISHRVVWRGSLHSPALAPPGADAVAYAHEYCALIEVTLKRGTTQWQQEFAPDIRHYNDFVNGTGTAPEDTYLLLIAPTLHDDTYRSVHQQNLERFNFVLLPLSVLAKILDTSILAFTMRHLEVRQLCHTLMDCCRDSSTLQEFLKGSDSSVLRWQQAVLQREKSAFLGVKSYEAMKGIGRTHIGVSEILQRLYRHPTVKHYFCTMGDRFGTRDIENSLELESLGCNLGKTLYDEPLFGPVPLLDFRSRAKRLVREVERING